MKNFIPGKTYRVEEFVDSTCGPDHQRVRALPPETLSRYTREPGMLYGYFDQIVEEENPLITSETAEKAVEELRERGMSYRQIAAWAVSACS